jgi:hypothetical protein
VAPTRAVVALPVAASRQLISGYTSRDANVVGGQLRTRRGQVSSRLSGAVTGEPVDGQLEPPVAIFSLSDGRRGRDDRDARVRAGRAQRGVRA